MENPLFDILLSDKYLDGTISEAELTELKSQFDSLEAFEREMKIQQHTLDAIQYEGSHQLITKMMPSIEQKLEAKGFFTNEEYEEEKPQSSKVKPLFPSRAKKGIAIAASFLLILIAIWIIPTPVDKMAAKTIIQEQSNSKLVVKAVQIKIDNEKAV